MNSSITIKKKETLFLREKPLSDYWFDSVEEISGFIIAYRENDFLMIFDSEGNVILEEKSTVLDIDDLFIIIEKDFYKGVYFYNGECIVPAEYDKIAFYADEIAAIKDDEQTSYDYGGKIIPQDQIKYLFDEGDSYF